MKSTTILPRLGLVLFVLTSSTACNHMMIQESGASALQQLSDSSQGPGSGITRYPVRMRELRSD